MKIDYKVFPLIPKNVNPHFDNYRRLHFDKNNIDVFVDEYDGIIEIHIVNKLDGYEINCGEIQIKDLQEESKTNEKVIKSWLKSLLPDKNEIQDKPLLVTSLRDDQEHVDTKILPQKKIDVDCGDKYSQPLGLHYLPMGVFSTGRRISKKLPPDQVDEED